MQTTKDAQSRTDAVLAAARAYHARQREWRQLEDIGAHRDLSGPAEQKLIDTFCELVPALGAISYLPRMIRGAVKRVFALAEIQLRLVVVTRKRPGGLQYTVARPDGEIVYRELTRQEYDQLDAALDVLERELRSMAGLPAAAPEQTRELPAVNAEVDAPVAAGGSKPGAEAEATMDLWDYTPANEIANDEYARDTKALWKILKANQWIRWKKPSSQRLFVHAADWNRYKKQRDKALDESSVEPLVEAVHSRMAKERESHFRSTSREEK